MEYDSKSDTCNNRGNWNHFKIIHKTPEQHIGKARNQGTTENRHVGHCTHTSGSTNVKVQNIFHVQNNITLAQIVNTEKLQQYIPRNKNCFTYTIVNTRHKGDKIYNNRNYSITHIIYKVLG